MDGISGSIFGFDFGSTLLKYREDYVASKMVPITITMPMPILMPMFPHYYLLALSLPSLQRGFVAL